MKALVLAEKGRFELVSRDSCTLPASEVMLKVAYCAICRTDAKMWSSGHRDLVLPRVLGHEICGFIDGDPRQPVAVWLMAVTKHSAWMNSLCQVRQG
jgi:D-arabinose 1-dehydrogenase-like Zn-dependent alcohol dehydrogenase